VILPLFFKAVFPGTQFSKLQEVPGDVIATPRGG